MLNMALKQREYLILCTRDMVLIKVVVFDEDHNIAVRLEDNPCILVQVGQPSDKFPYMYIYASLVRE